MITVWSVVRWLHLVGAVLWVGGQLALAAVVAPAAHRLLGEKDRRALMDVVGRRYGLVTLAGALPVQVATGLALAYHRGVDLGSFGQSDWGQVLSFKIVLVVVAVVLAGVHGMLSARDRRGPARLASFSGLATSVGVLFLAAALVP